MESAKMNRLKTILIAGLLSLAGCYAGNIPVKMTTQNNVCYWNSTKPITKDIITTDEGKVSASVTYKAVDYECDGHIDRIISTAKAWHFMDDRSIVERTYEIDTWRESLENISNPELKECLTSEFDTLDKIVQNK